MRPRVVVVAAARDAFPETRRFVEVALVEVELVKMPFTLVRVSVELS